MPWHQQYPSLLVPGQGAAVVRSATPVSGRLLSAAELQPRGVGRGRLLAVRVQSTVEVPQVCADLRSSAGWCGTRATRALQGRPRVAPARGGLRGHGPGLGGGTGPRRREPGHSPLGTVVRQRQRCRHGAAAGSQFSTKVRVAASSRWARGTTLRKPWAGAARSPLARARRRRRSVPELAPVARCPQDRRQARRSCCGQGGRAPLTGVPWTRPPPAFAVARGRVVAPGPPPTGGGARSTARAAASGPGRRWARRPSPPLNHW